MIKHFLALALVLLVACGRPAPEPHRSATPERVISLSPSITETLYDLGLEDRLVGISRFGTSDSARNIQIVGDFLNINYETIVALKPDLVILEKSADTQKARLESLGIPCLETASLSIEQVLQTIQAIGETCDASDRSTALVESFRQQVEEHRNTPDDRIRTLMTFGASADADPSQPIYAFGAECIHTELLEIAGGENVVTDNRPSVVLSREALLRLDPELIIELTTGGPENQWEHLEQIDAVQHGRIVVLDGDYTCIPSPRNLTQTLRDISRTLRQNDLEAE